VSNFLLKQVALLSQRCCAVLHVCQYLASIVQYVECRLLLLVTSASDLPLHTIKLCSLLFVMVVHAGCGKQDSLMRVVYATVAVVCTPPVVEPTARYYSRIAIFAYHTCI